MYRVTAPRAHIEMGILRTPQVNLTVVVNYPEVSNTGNASGRLGLKVNLVETKFGLDDTWIRYTSRADDQDAIEDQGTKPGVIRDKIARDTGFQFRTLATHTPVELLPGVMVLALPALVLVLPGKTLGPALDTFWRNEEQGGIDFKLIVWLFEITASGLTIAHGGPDGSVDRHEFPRAFRVEA